ncbi:MAG: AI-2E family transporter [Puniceicoccales bacterium]|jgi:predicted PurR-regulated permease PerM|nr:AI-2E family transporter [Puniceicoccales bacterium]
MHDRPPSLPLSPLQRRLVSAALACVAAGVILAFVSGAFWLLGQFLEVTGAALWPVILAGVLSFLLQPLFVFLERRLRFSRMAAIVVLYALVACVCMLLAAWLLPAMLRQAMAFIETLPALWARAWEAVAPLVPSDIRPWLERLSPGVDVVGGAASAPPHALPGAASGGAAVTAPGAGWVGTLAAMALSALTKAGLGLQAFFIKAGGLAIVPVYLFYLLGMRGDFVGDACREIRFLPDGLRRDLTFLARQFAGILTAYFRGQLLIGLLLGVFLALGWTLAGLKFGLLLGLFIGLLNMVPFLGTMLGFLLALPVAYFQPGGSIGLLAGVAGVLVAGMLLEGLVLTPRIMGDRMGLHPMVVTFSVFFWGLVLDGVLGMVLAVPLTAFFVVFWRLLRAKYLSGAGEAVETEQGS